MEIEGETMIPFDHHETEIKFEGFVLGKCTLKVRYLVREDEEGQTSSILRIPNMKAL